MKQNILNLLRKYLNDQCTPEELKKVQAVLGSDQYEEEWTAVLKEDAERVMHGKISAGLDTDKTNQLLERIVQSTDMDTAPQPGSRQNRQNSPNRNTGTILQNRSKWWGRMAASVLILLTGGLAFLILSLLSAEEFSQTVTIAGEQTEILLPDGTQVWLDDQSSLRYPDEFNGDTRDVTLEGSAFFDVAPNLSQPFRVHSSELTVNVLGTSFNVRAYDDDRNVTVTVASGSVSVSPASSELNSEVVQINTLVPGDQLIYNKRSDEYSFQRVAFEEALSLKEGVLIFQDQPLEDVVHALERRYNIRFQFADESAKTQPLTFKPTGTDIDEILQILSLITGLDVDWDHENREVFLK